ncbi:MAG: N-acetylmuramoyl-L-alanine amidase [Rhodospirillales bacterium]
MTADRWSSPNFDARPEGASVDMLVLHYTGMPSANDALVRLCNPDAKVSAHYLVDEDGSVHALVDEENRAWHAGVAYWRGHTNVNARSIGIELVNPGHEWGLKPFPDAQMAALSALAKDIVVRHAVPARNVVGHSDVAPRRKQDPGELFDWRRLADVGIGLWPAAGELLSGPSGADVVHLLNEIGYETEDMTATLTAFQRRFRPESIDGEVDAETAALIDAVAAQARRAD